MCSDDARSLPHPSLVAFGAACAFAASIACPCTAQDATQPPPPADTAGDRTDIATLDVRVTDTSGAPIPCRITLLPARDAGQNLRPELFPRTDAAPDRLAVRRNSIYTIDGAARVTVPAGTYTLLATRGLEWSIATREIELRVGATEHATLVLEHELDTTGWISGDFHLHTLTHSGHGDANMPERIISIVGEGVEFAVATDHNHNTDYGPTIRRVNAQRHLSAVTGNEVSTGIGHFNVYPLDPDAPEPPFRVQSARPLFAILREQPNPYGVTPIIQLNHPRWSSINYFGHAALDPVTGTSESERYSHDFDTIEIFNENEGWGYYDPDTTDLPIGSGSFSVLRDWFNLLNRGHRYTAVGNSDSHDVEAETAGYPRNFVLSDAAGPADIDPVQIVDAQRRHAVFTTTGPFVTYTAGGVPMGGDVTAQAGPDGTPYVTLAIDVSAASWIDVDVVKIVVNGDIVREIPVPQTRSVRRLASEVDIPLHADAWLTILAEGDEPLSPVVHDQGRPILPLAVLNPVWIDANRDGVWTSPIDRARAAVAAATDAPAILSPLAAAPPSDRAMVAQAIAEAKPSFATSVIAPLLGDDDRHTRLSAVRAAERLADPALAPALAAAHRDTHGDTHLAMSLFRARTACAPDANARNDIRRALLDTLRRSGARGLARFAEEVSPILGGRFITEWLYAGMFASPNAGSVITLEHPPERTQRPTGSFETKQGMTGWRTVDADASGYTDLTRVETSAGVHENAIAYLFTWLVSPDDREVVYTLGTDDGCRLWINGEPVYQDGSSHGADPLQHIGTARLKAGRNAILLKVANGDGGFGAYFRVLDDEVHASTRPE